MGRVCALGLVVVVGGCFQPAYETGAPCSPVAQACPGDLECIEGFCGGRPPQQSDAPPPIDGSMETDAPSIDAPAGLGPWGTPTPVPGVNSGSSEEDPSYTADRLTIVFARNDDLMIGTRADTTNAFTVVPLDLLNTPLQENSPEISADGTTLYFTSERDGGAGDHDVYVSTRIGNTFLTAMRVTEVSRTGDDEGDLAVAPDGLTLIVARDNVMMRSTRASTTAVWSTPAAIPNVNFGTGPAAPSLDDDGNLYFHANATRDLFFAARSGNTFLAPVPITELNTGGRDAAPFVSADGRHLVFERAGQILESSR